MGAPGRFSVALVWHGFFSFACLCLFSRPFVGIQSRLFGGSPRGLPELHKLCRGLVDGACVVTFGITNSWRAPSDRRAGGLIRAIGSEHPPPQPCLRVRVEPFHPDMQPFSHVMSCLHFDRSISPCLLSMGGNGPGPRGLTRVPSSSLLSPSARAKPGVRDGNW